MFYDTFACLCQQRGIAPSRAAIDAGISKSLVTKWKNNGTELPSPEVLSKLSKYFGVTTAYLLGLSSESQVDTLNFQIAQLRKDLSTASPERAAEIRSELALKEESYEDLVLAMRLTAQKNAPTEFALDEGEKLLINMYRRLPEAKRQLVLSTVKAFAESL